MIKCKLIYANCKSEYDINHHLDFDFNFIKDSLKIKEIIHFDTKINENNIYIYIFYKT